MRMGAIDRYNVRLCPLQPQTEQIWQVIDMKEPATSGSIIAILRQIVRPVVFEGTGAER